MKSPGLNVVALITRLGLDPGYSYGYGAGGRSVWQRWAEGPLWQQERCAAPT